MARKQKQKCDLKIMDNFLDEEDFKYLVDMFSHQETPWYYTPGISDDDSSAQYSGSNPLDNFMFAHMIYSDYQPRSNCYQKLYDMIIPKLVNNIGMDFNVMTRMKANMYPRTSEVNIHPWHVDTSHQPLLRGALLMLNTCDGYTGFIDGTQVDSVGNRMVLFDATEKHHSTSCSNAPVRLTLNINYV
tara:strand:+ start:429 stop:989 length:561 start_codon:yes stop_codon:yes gene_type:complete